MMFILSLFLYKITDKKEKMLKSYLREVNKLLWKTSTKYKNTKLTFVIYSDLLSQIKFDITSAYYFVDIYEPHTQNILGFCR
jgi:K+-transporting ATPase A subunit